MTRHAATLPSTAAEHLPPTVRVQWSSLIARDGLGGSTNALDLDHPSAECRSSAPTGDSPLRRIDLSVRLEPVMNAPDRVRFAAELTEDGRRRTLEPSGDLPGSVTIVGEHVHFVIDSAGISSAPGIGDGVREPMLLVVLDAGGDAILVRGRIAGLAGLPPGALGRPRVAIDETTPVGR
ncbi:MAG: hypothetical protein ACYTEV_10870 [Planctomycetota bacterium]|jgi:hypothetical protein